MAGAVDITARGAVEAGERGGGSAASRFSRGVKAWHETMQFFTGRRRWERGGRPTLLDPAKRVFAEVRRWVEGRSYKRIEAKKAAVEEVLRRLEAEGKVSSLVGWHYIRQALNTLPLRICVFKNGNSSQDEVISV